MAERLELKGGMVEIWGAWKTVSMGVYRLSSDEGVKAKVAKESPELPVITFHSFSAILK